jgi:hypothetical protein
MGAIPDEKGLYVRCPETMVRQRTRSPHLPLLTWRGVLLTNIAYDLQVPSTARGADGLSHPFTLANGWHSG